MFSGEKEPTWDINLKCKTEFKKPHKDGDLGFHILPSDSSERADGNAINEKNWEGLGRRLIAKPKPKRPKWR